MLVTLCFDPSRGTPSVRWVEGNEVMETVSVDSEKGIFTFATTHNSTYAIEYPSSDNASVVAISVIAVYLALIVAAVLMILKRRNGQ